MKVQQMIDLVKMHHPNMGETEIMKMLNLAIKDFSNKTRIIKDVITERLAEDQRYYHLNDDIIEVTRVDMDVADGFGKKIPRLMSPPTEMDEA